MQRVRVLITLLGNNYPPKLHSKLSNYHFTRRMISDQSASLTSSRYPSLIRGNYAQVGEDDITHFKRILKDPLNVITDPQDLVGYNIDWMKIFRGKTWEFEYWIHVLSSDDVLGFGTWSLNPLSLWRWTLSPWLWPWYSKHFPLRNKELGTVYPLTLDWLAKPSCLKRS